MAEKLKWGTVFLIFLGGFIVLLYWTIGPTALTFLIYAIMGLCLLVAGGMVTRWLIRDGAMIANSDARLTATVAAQVAKDIAKIYGDHSKNKVITAQAEVDAPRQPTMLPELPESSIISPSSIEGLDDKAEYIDHDLLQ